MTRKVRAHVGGDAMPTNALTPKHLTKQEFGRRVYKLMIAKGWHQSELARQADLPRDSVSVYIRGRSLPTPRKLEKLAQALGVQPEELLPNHLEGAIEEDAPAFELRVSVGDPSMAWVRVNRLVSMGVAVKIAELLEHDNALNRSGSGGKVKV